MQLHAFYSKAADAMFGHILYKKANSEELAYVTGVYVCKKRGEVDYEWADKVYVGLIEGSPIRITRGINE